LLSNDERWKGNDLGILYPQAKMLLDAHRAGLNLDPALMVGRQSLFLHRTDLRDLGKLCPGKLENYTWGEYSDRFFVECLHISQPHSLDYSAFEGADILHDLNQPVPDHLKERYNAVIEAGTLEHIFNFPAAIANLMQMTRVGGTIFASTVANNLCGHGFYQFSPELIFRIFSAENGFKLGRVLAAKASFPGVELEPLGGLYEVIDPAVVGARVGLMTPFPVMLFFEATRIDAVVPFAHTPQQSDYAAAWASSETGPTDPSAKPPKRIPGYSLLRSCLRATPMWERLRNRREGKRQQREFSFGNPRFFRKL
jgi:hypothetical protein